MEIQRGRAAKSQEEIRLQIAAELGEEAGPLILVLSFVLHLREEPQQVFSMFFLNILYRSYNQ